MRQFYQAAFAVAGVMLLSGSVSAANPVKPNQAVGIEIGHRGCRMVMITVEPTPWKQLDLRVHYEKTVTIPLGTSLAETGKLHETDISKTATEVKRLFEMACSELSIPTHNIHIATAASLDGATGLNDLCKAITEKTNRPVTNFTAAREVLYGMRQIMPADYMKGAWYADLGSGKCGVLPES
ncbi:MAG: hypothetical protein EBV06_12640 [Planctomycetia bacterium]|nr:hypothetical protein [Planctomycetia bacterium]